MRQLVAHTLRSGKNMAIETYGALTQGASVCREHCGDLTLYLGSARHHDHVSQHVPIDEHWLLQGSLRAAWRFAEVAPCLEPARKMKVWKLHTHERRPPVEKSGSCLPVCFWNGTVLKVGGR